MSQILFPTDTTGVTPASWDIILIADVSDSNNPKDCTLAELPISTATQTALDAKQDTLTGLTASVAELNYTDWVTSAIQTQIDSKAPIASPTFTGTVSGITAAMVWAPSWSGSSTGTNTGDQTITNTSDATSHTATLSATGWSIKLVEWSGITLTTTGTSADWIVTIAATGWSGTVTATAGSLTSNSVVLGAGTTDTKVSTWITTDGTAQLNLWVNATTIGKVKMFGNTSGDVTIQPTAAAGTATVQTLPATTGTLVNRVTTANGVSASNSDGALTVTLGAITPTTVNGHTFTAGSSTFTGTASAVYTFPTSTKTIAANDGSNMTLASQATGDIITASSTTALNRLADVAVWSVLVSGGVWVAPAYSASPQVTTIELGHATDTTIARVSAWVIAVEGVTVPTISSTSTLTNKRNQPRIVSAASYTTDTGTSLDFSTCDIFIVTAQAGALKFNNPSGTPVHWEKIIIRCKDNWTARALTYDTQYRAVGVTLPTTTVISKTLYLGGVWNTTDTKLDIIAVSQEV